MCKFLKISRSVYYYESKATEPKNVLDNLVISLFHQSRNHYGTRKLKVELAKKNHIVSRRRIAKIMAKYALVSTYTAKHFKVHSTSCNEDVIENIVNREFDNRNKLDVVVSDLTYVNVQGKWHYICVLLDLYNREIIGYAAGAHKNAQLVHKAFTTVKANLKDIAIFHTDRGNEFKNNVIDELLETFDIRRSLSKKGCPYDNAVAEATFKIIKTEFAFNKTFDSLEQLDYLLFDYVNWFNNVRIHGSLGYLTPAQYKSLSTTLSA